MKTRFAKNFASLSLLQIANYIFPLLTLPYLFRVLGPDRLGLVSFASSIISYFIIITDYGFNLSATRQVAIHRNDKRKVNEIFSSVMAVKLFLILICFFVLTLAVTYVERLETDKLIYFITFSTVIGQILLPSWLFQGMERMGYIAILNFLSKLTFTASIFFFVKNSSDYLLVPALTALGSMIAGVLSIVFIVKKLEVSFFIPEWKSIKLQIIDGWDIFYSSIAISMYTTSTAVILGFFSGNAAVGFFSGADRIIQALKSLYAPLSQAIFPLISKKFHEDKFLALQLAKKITIFAGIFMLGVSAFLFFGADLITSLILGEGFERSAHILRIMSPLPFLIAMSNIFGIQIMLNIGCKKHFSTIITLAALLGLLLNFALAPILLEKGSAITIVTVELFVTITMSVFLFFKIKSLISAGEKS